MTIQVTLWTQATFAAFDEHLQMITLAGDPKFALLFLFPVLLWMSGAGVAAPVIGAIVASDLLNALVKWPLQGPRPFWVDDAVREFWMTCESGYGMPSGHCMVSAAWAFLLASRVSSRHTRVLAFVAASSFVGLVALSRVHVGAHFLDQVLAGTACGVAFAALFAKSRRVRSGLADVISASSVSAATKTAIAYATVFIGVPVAEFFLLSFWADPLHSVTLAKKGCSDPKLVSAHTSPFAGIMRNGGMLFGVIVGLAALQSLRRHGLVAYDVAPFAPRHDEGGRESGGFPLSARDGVRLGLGLALVWALHCALHPLLRELVSLVTTADTAAYALAAVVAAFAEWSFMAVCQCAVIPLVLTFLLPPLVRPVAANPDKKQ